MFRSASTRLVLTAGIACCTLALVLIPGATSADGQALIEGSSGNTASSNTILTTSGANGLKVTGGPTGSPEIALDGVAAKRLGQRYRPGERVWIKTKNRGYWRYPLE